jgi:hypothetical protein
MELKKGFIWDFSGFIQGFEMGFTWWLMNLLSLPSQ